ncbi:metallophosphoesterase [Sphingomonas sp.]|uniref:metallophosphoesterase n=1 Tax=Sphingomonas sp. TaxID=28214 RepID=UPI002DD61BD5|nr:metallophosphoesterase [Sphingomonas sp.]
MRLVVRLFIFGAVVAAIVAGWGYREARRMPVVRHATVELREWPRDAAPMRVVVIGDIHIGSATMDVGQLARIVSRVNALRPDLVLIAGDFIAGHDPGLSERRAPALVTPLRGLVAPLGRVAVMGNHDHWTGAAPVRAALDGAGIDVLDNAARRYGPLTVVGIDDRHTRNDRIGPAMAAARRLGGPRLVLSHGPDIVPDMPADAPLVVASHTHCGQIVIPFYGPPVVPSNHGRRYLCGIIREAGRATIVTAGLGTSVLPVRIGAPPDLWLLTLTGVSRARS